MPLKRCSSLHNENHVFDMFFLFTKTKNTHERKFRWIDDFWVRRCRCPVEICRVVAAGTVDGVLGMKKKREQEIEGALKNTLNTNLKIKKS